MKVLQVVSYFAQRRGGNINVCYNLSKELSKLGHDVTVIAADYRYDQGYAQSLKNVEVIPFRQTAKLGPFLYTPGMKWWLRENISRYDVVHLHDFRSYQSSVAYRNAKKFDVPYIIQPHGTLLRIVERKGLKQLYDIVWGNSIRRHASKFIAVSGSEAEQFRQAGIPEEKISLIPNGVDHVSFTSLPLTKRFREKYDIHEKHIILYAGRLHKLKGIDFLIRAFSLFLQSWTGSNVALVIVGPDGGYQSALEELVEQLGLSDKVRFIGFNPSLTAAYQDADVLVYPSVYEIFGLVPFEALLCGTPVIVTDDCGCGEIIKEAECGYLVHYGDVAGLAETLRFALEHPDVNRRMVVTGQQYVQEHLTWGSVVKQVEMMYENCISSGRMSR